MRHCRLGYVGHDPDEQLAKLIGLSKQGVELIDRVDKVLFALSDLVMRFKALLAFRRESPRSLCVSTTVPSRAASTFRSVAFSAAV
jgi:hypothetical protein